MVIRDEILMEILRGSHTCTSIEKGPTFEVLSYDQILILDKISDRLRPLRVF